MESAGEVDQRPGIAVSGEREDRQQAGCVAAGATADAADRDAVLSGRRAERAPVAAPPDEGAGSPAATAADGQRMRAWTADV